jgi:glycosyltransferase involved in cell wall biosynthesis
MRLAYFTDTPRIGGAERFLVNLVAGVANAGHDVTVLAPQDALLKLIAAEVPEAALVRTGPRDYYTLPSRGERLAALVRSLPAVTHAFSGVEADLLHVNNGGYPGSELCRVATVLGRLARVPRRLLTVHSAPWPRERLLPRLQILLDQTVWRSVDAVHATTEFVRRGLTELRGMPPGLGTHIPYGVAEPAGQQEAAALRERLAGSALLVGMISATADPEKGHDVFIEALAQSDRELRAVIVGPVPDRLPQQMRMLGLEHRVTLEGPVPPAAVGPYAHAADVLVVPSTAYESLPLVVLESMAAGKPVFASRLSGIPEAILDGETGRLFTPGAVDELTALFREAAGDPRQLEQWGSSGRRRWAADFSVEATTHKMLAFYEELLTRERSRRTSS